jgi:cytochrome c oxidase assembly factor CtaG
MSANGSIWAVHLHPFCWALVLLLGLLYAFAVSRPAFRATRAEVVRFAAGLLVLLVAGSYPLADVAVHWSLTALVLQRLVLTLAVPPLLLTGTPRTLLAALTRAAPVDAVVRVASRPPVAVVVVTVVFVATLSTAAVEAQASSVVVRGFLDVVLVLAGVVLWAPVLNRLPGGPRLSPLGRAAYLVVQSIVPSFLAVVWILARHPLYPAFDHGPTVAGLAPLTDQQLAGFVAKFGTIAVLWTVAYVFVRQTDPKSARDVDTDPLTWTDVQRHLERVERRERRSHAWLPGSAVPPDGERPEEPGPVP